MSRRISLSVPSRPLSASTEVLPNRFALADAPFVPEIPLNYEKNEAVPLDWITINSLLFPVRLSGSCKVSSRCSDELDLFVASAFSSTDCAVDVIMNPYYQKRDGIVILTGDMNTRFHRPSSNVTHLGDYFGLDSYEEHLLKMSLHHRLFLASTNSRHLDRRNLIWFPLSSSHR